MSGANSLQPGKHAPLGFTDGPAGRTHREYRDVCAPQYVEISGYFAGPGG
jgi:hypothetical protein